MAPIPGENVPPAVGPLRQKHAWNTLKQSLSEIGSLDCLCVWNQIILTETWYTHLKRHDDFKQNNTTF